MRQALLKNVCDKDGGYVRLRLAAPDVPLVYTILNRLWHNNDLHCCPRPRRKLECEDKDILKHGEFAIW